LAAPPHEPTSPLGRALIAATAAVGVLLVGVLALSMTPDRMGESESALTASTLLVLAPGSESGVAVPQQGDQGVVPTSVAGTILRAVSTFVNAPPTSTIVRNDAIAATTTAEPSAASTADAVPSPTSTPGSTALAGELPGNTPPPVSDANDQSVTEDSAAAVPSVDDAGEPGVVAPQDPGESSGRSSVAGSAESSATSTSTSSSTSTTSSPSTAPGTTGPGTTGSPEPTAPLGTAGAPLTTSALTVHPAKQLGD